MTIKNRSGFIRIMLLQKKALYNLLQLNLAQNEGAYKCSSLHHWQIANYREMSSEELVKQLLMLGIALEAKDFEIFSKGFETPEELCEALTQERKPLEKDQIFLIIFELWRRLLPERRTISIFCDELDFQMMAYDLDRPNSISDTLAYLEQILEEHDDQGIEPTYALEMVQSFCANDIESFLFDYILNEVEAKNDRYATELLDGFKRFVKKRFAFNYLAARTQILIDPEEGYDLLEELIGQINENSSLELIEEMLFFLANSGNHSLFYLLAHKTLSLLKTEKDFQIFLEACYSHYDYLELKTPSLGIAFLYHSRKKIDKESLLSVSDPGLAEIRSILDQRLHFAEE